MFNEQPKVARKLTPKQQAFLDYLKQNVRRDGAFPTWASMMKELGWKSPNSVTQYINVLIKKGHLEKRGSYYDFTDESMYMTTEKLDKIDKILSGLSNEIVKKNANKPAIVESARKQIHDIIEGKK